MISEAPMLIRWRVENHFPDLKKITVNKQIYYRHENILFQLSPFTVYATTDTELTCENFKDETLLVYRNNGWVIKGIWQKYINGYISRINKSKKAIDESVRKEQRLVAKRKRVEFEAKVRRFQKMILEKMTPKIHLLGENPIIINVGYPYYEHGWEAYDWYGSNITNLVKVTGELNESTVGEYILVYTVKDKEGIVGKATRVIKVVVDNKNTIQGFSSLDLVDLDITLNSDTTVGESVDALEFLSNLLNVPIRKFVVDDNETVDIDE